MTRLAGIAVGAPLIGLSAVGVRLVGRALGALLAGTAIVARPAGIAVRCPGTEVDGVIGEVVEGARGLIGGNDVLLSGRAAGAPGDSAHPVRHAMHRAGPSAGTAEPAGEALRARVRGASTHVLR